MQVYVKNYKNKYYRGFDITSFKDLDSFCRVYDISLKFNVESGNFDDHEMNIKEAFKDASPNKDILFLFDEPFERKQNGKSYLEKLDILFDNINNIYKFHSDMDLDLLGNLLVFRCYYDASVAEFLLDPLAMNYFSNVTAQRVFETLIMIPTLSSLQYAQKLLQSKQWDIKGDGFDNT